MIDLRLGDCLEIMKTIPDKSIDLVLTDPPYNLGYSGRGLVNKFEGFANDNLGDGFSGWFNNCLMQFGRILKDNCACYIWCDYRIYPTMFNLVKNYFEIKNCIVWYKNNFGMGQHYRFQHEFLIYAIKGEHKLKLDKRNQSDVWQFSKEDVNSYVHPTQKPVFAMYKPVEFSCPLGGVVIDPFMGSGTTGVACKELGRNFIGIEISEQYFNIAQRRISQTQQDLFVGLKNDL